MGIDRKMQNLCQNARIGRMFEINSRTSVRLTYEFLSSFDVSKSNRGGDITQVQFQLMNQTFAITLTQFASMFGMNTSLPREPPTSYNSLALMHPSTPPQSMVKVYRIDNLWEA